MLVLAMQFSKGVAGPGPQKALTVDKKDADRGRRCLPEHNKAPVRQA